jgi:nucleoside-diphosphate-sugar epimerase
MKKVIVTGATGFIGSNLVKKLISLNYKVGIIARETSNLKNLNSIETKLEIFRINKNSSNIRQIQNFFSYIKPTTVFHLASMFTANHKFNDIDKLIDSNIKLGSFILDVAVSRGVKNFINTGTSWQHYKNKNYNPVCLYAATKQAFEQIIEYYTNAYELKAITLKLFDTYGPNDNRGKLISTLIEIGENNKIFDVSPGNQKIDLVYIDDVVNAFLSAENLLEGMPKSVHKKFGVASGNPLSIREIVNLLNKIMDKEIKINWGAKPYRKREVMEPWSNFKTLPNWEPHVSIDDGLRLITKAI